MSVGDGKEVAIVGIPLGYGAANTGSELGVEAMRASSIRGKFLTEHIADLGYSVRGNGNVEVVRPTRIADIDQNPKYLNEIAASCAVMASVLRTELERGAFPIILGGDHSIAIGTFSGIASYYRERGEDV